MPTYHRPKVAYIDPGSRDVGALVLLAAAAVAAAAVAMFVLAHLVLLAATAATFAVVMGGVLAAMRWVASPKRLRQQIPQRYRARVPAPRPARAIPASRPGAIGAPAQHLHLHLYGVAAEYVAAITRRAEGARPAIEEDPWPPSSS
jgi:hypothetical protein